MIPPAKTSALVAIISLASAAGCRSVPWPDMWPFPHYEMTTYRAPAERIEEINKYAAQATGTDTPEQRKIADDLAKQLQSETDPLVRLAIVRNLCEFHVPVTQQALEAGLADDNTTVRLACCRALGKIGNAASVGPLAQSLRSDRDADVRKAAAEALGNFKAPEAIQALAAALEDRDPAMQYVGVQSMKSITGKDYGGDMQAWRQLAAGESPPPPKPPSLARRLRSASPF